MLVTSSVSLDGKSVHIESLVQLNSISLIGLLVYIFNGFMARDPVCKRRIIIKIIEIFWSLGPRPLRKRRNP